MRRLLLVIVPCVALSWWMLSPLRVDAFSGHPMVNSERSFHVQDAAWILTFRVEGTKAENDMTVTITVESGPNKTQKLFKVIKSGSIHQFNSEEFKPGKVTLTVKFKEQDEAGHWTYTVRSMG